MAMKETERSLRTYFLFVGFGTLLFCLGEFEDVSHYNGLFDLPVSWILAMVVPLVTRIAVSVAFVVAGFKLKTALLGNADWIQKILIASALALLVDGALVAIVLGTDVADTEIVRAIVGIAITVYLLHNVRRLSAEAKERAGIPPAPPIARAL